MQMLEPSVHIFHPGGADEEQAIACHEHVLAREAALRSFTLSFYSSPASTTRLMHFIKAQPKGDFYSGIADTRCYFEVPQAWQRQIQRSTPELVSLLEEGAIEDCHAIPAAADRKGQALLEPRQGVLV